MDASAAQVLIVGGPEGEEELMAIELDDGEAIPLFESVEEAEEFLRSIGDYGEHWRAREVSPQHLIEVLEYQGEEVVHVALSPPPERMTGGMEVQVIDREMLAQLLRNQS